MLAVWLYRKRNFSFIYSGLILLLFSPLIEPLYQLFVFINEISSWLVIFLFLTFWNSYVLIAIGMILLVKRVVFKVKNQEWDLHKRLFSLGVGGIVLAPVFKYMYYETVSRMNVNYANLVADRFAVASFLVGAMLIIIVLITTRLTEKSRKKFMLTGLILVLIFPLVKRGSHHYYLIIFPYSPYEAPYFSYPFGILTVIVGILLLIKGILSLKKSHYR